MTPSRIAGHAAGSAVFSGVWLVAVTAPAAPTSWPLLVAAGLPQAVAVLSLLLQHHAATLDGAGQPTPRPAISRPQPRPRKELAR